MANWKRWIAQTLIFCQILLTVREILIYRSSRPEVFCEKYILKIIAKFTGNTPARVSCSFIEKETLAQVFPVNFAIILRTFFFNGTPPVAASESSLDLKNFIEGTINLNTAFISLMNREIIYTISSCYHEFKNETN